MRFLITGGSGGIGFALTQSLLNQGHYVCATFLSKSQSDLISDPKLTWVRVDLQDVDSLKIMITNLGNFDGLIHCAGVAQTERISSITTSKVREMMLVNVESAVAAIVALLPGMIQRNFGRIILLGSIVGREGGIGLAGYAASKSALDGLVRSIHKEIILVKRDFPNLNLTINLIRPGYVTTPMTSNISEKVRAKIIEKSSLGRFLNPEEIADFIVFLLGPSSEYISGRLLDIDGGQEL